MDYKKIIKSRNVRLKVLRMLSFIPDKMMLKLQYRIKMGRKLNLKNPQRFTEKIQWYKLYYKNPKMIQCVDKYDVREYVKSKELEDILIPCYGVYESVDQIDWESLPNQFVMKDTLGGGGNSVIIVKDKNNTDVEELKRCGAEWTSIRAHVRDAGREWPYYNGKNHRIIIEKYIESDANKGGLIDYKFFCFNGNPEFLYVMGERVVGKEVKVAILNSDYSETEVQRVGDTQYKDYTKPYNYNEMKSIVEILSEEFPHVRVDMYNIEGRIYFGELTFFNASGYMKYNPDSADYVFGKKWICKE